MNKIEALTNKIQDFIDGFVKEAGLELVELNVISRKNNILIQVLADRTHGGITVDECSSLNREISEKLEEEDLIPESYLVEVSSPGLDRLLKTRKDFIRVEGKEIHVLLLEAIGGNVEFSGILKTVEDENIILNGKKEDIAIPLQKISKGMQVI